MSRLGKKLLAVLLTGVMTASLAACGGGDKPANTENAESAAPAGSEAASADAAGGSAAAEVDPNNPYAGVDISEPVTITYMTVGDAYTNGEQEKALEEINKILNEKANATLEVYNIGWTDYLSNYNLTLAQMDGTVDLVGTATDWLDAWPNAQSGAFLELSEDMLKTYAPQTYAQVPAENWEKCKYNGNIYFLPEDHFTQWTNHGFMYRGDWAKEAGLENGVHSWEDMTTYFKGVKENHPDVIPWDSDGTHNVQLTGSYLASKTDFISIDGICAGALYGGHKEDPYTLWSPFYEGDELIEFAKLMKEWDTLGVWKTDVLNNTGVDNREEMYLGQTSADQHHTETWYGTVRPKMEEQQPGSDVRFFWFGEESGNLVRLNITHGAMAVSAASENPERALMVADLLRNDPEIYRLITLGREGVQYEVVDEEAKTWKRPDSWTNDQEMGIAFNYWWGRNDDLELVDSKRDQVTYKELCEAYDAVAIDYPYGLLVADLTNIQSQINNINEIHDNYTKQIAFGKYSGTAEEIVAEYREALKNAGFEEVLAELQAQVDAIYK